MPCQNHPGIEEGLVVCWRCRREFCYNCAVELDNYYFCGDCKTPQVRDILAGTDLFSLDFAPLEKRFLAWVIDGVIKWALWGFVIIIGIIVGIGIGGTLQNPTAIWTIRAFTVMGHLAGMLYEAFMTASPKGQTLGKMAANIKLVTAEGNPISAKQAWWRAILKLFFYYLTCDCPCSVGILFDGVFTLSQERTSLHDLGSRTRIVNA